MIDIHCWLLLPAFGKLALVTSNFSSLTIRLSFR
jgi:hypothetical protein